MAEWWGGGEKDRQIDRETEREMTERDYRDKNDRDKERDKDKNDRKRDKREPGQNRMDSDD